MHLSLDYPTIPAYGHLGSFMSSLPYYASTTLSDTLMSVEQGAEVLKLHVRTVRSYVRDGRLKATRIGKQYRIALSDLEAFAGRPVASHAERVLVPGGLV